MIARTALRAVLSAVLCAGLVTLGPGARSAQAALVTTQQVEQERAAEADARRRLANLVMRDDVQAELAALGLEPGEARARIAALSDAEVAWIAGRLEELPAGEGAVGVVVGAMLVVFLVLLVTDILGLTDVFTFVKKPARR